MTYKTTSRAVSTPRTPKICLAPLSHKHHGERLCHVHVRNPRRRRRESRLRLSSVAYVADSPDPVLPARAVYNAARVSETRAVTSAGGDTKRILPIHPPSLVDGGSTVSLLAGSTVEAKGGGIA